MVNILASTQPTRFVPWSKLKFVFQNSHPTQPLPSHFNQHSKNVLKTPPPPISYHRPPTTFRHLLKLFTNFHHLPSIPAASFYHFSLLLSTSHYLPPPPATSHHLPPLPTTSHYFPLVQLLQLLLLINKVFDLLCLMQLL